MTPADSQALNDVLAWHRLSSHAPGRFAPGPGGLDWITQPDPFQHWVGTQRLTLPLRPVRPDDTHPEPSTDARTRLGQLLQDSLGLSAWKEFGQSRWALRMNPSSGNLHPTEATLICPAIPGLSDTPFVAHYAPRDHSLELRARVP
ncbi:MAG: SagB/ThcOx family dehydrogenase, partial [Candidatus Cloacimonetes bacterium]|nr:SagB/ThcOx family dehydrogenase [Candidatus Cloacimonadota bacterium]